MEVNLQYQIGWTFKKEKENNKLNQEINEKSTTVRLASTAIEFFFVLFLFLFFWDNAGLTKGRMTEESSFLVLMHYNRNSGCSKKRSAEYTA